MKILLYSAALAALLLFACSKPSGPDDSGTGSETGNVAIVSGKLFALNGNPANNAHVYFVKVNYNPRSGALEKVRAISDTVTTDSTGLYGTNDLDTGTYNVFGTGTDGNLSLLDSVTVTGDSQVVPPDTLKLPGSLAGIIKMQGTDDPRSVFVIPLGTNGFVNTGITGSFSLSKMAEGEYSVRFLSVLDRYLPMDTTFTVTAGKDSILLDSIELPLKIPTPTGFTISYDTLKQIVTLSWYRIDPTKVKGYNVYRQHVGRADSLLTPVAIVDTFYVDSTGVQDETYIYGVVGVDFENKEGIRATDSVVITGFYHQIDSFAYSGKKPDDMSIGLNDMILLRNDQSVTILDSSLNLISSFQLLPTPFGNGFGIEMDTLGRIWVAEYNTGEVNIYDLSGNIVDTIRDPELFRPNLIRKHPNGNMIIKSQPDSGYALRIYNAAGDFISYFPNDSQILYMEIVDISFDSSRNWIFLNWKDSTIYIYDSLGNQLQSHTQNSMVYWMEYFSDGSFAIAPHNQTGALYFYNPDFEFQAVFIGDRVRAYPFAVDSRSRLILIGTSYLRMYEK